MFPLCAAELKGRGLWTRCGFELILGNDPGQTTRIPGRLFPDDFVLLGSSYEEIRTLLSATSEFGSKVQLHFDPEKSAIVIFNEANLGTERPAKIQQTELGTQTHY